MTHPEGGQNNSPTSRVSIETLPAVPFGGTVWDILDAYDEAGILTGHLLRDPFNGQVFLIPRSSDEARLVGTNGRIEAREHTAVLTYDPLIVSPE